MTEACSTCAHGKPMVGVWLCTQTNKVMTSPKKCECFLKNTKQARLDE